MLRFQPEGMIDKLGRMGEIKGAFLDYSPVFRSLGGTSAFWMVVIPGSLPAGRASMRAGSCRGKFWGDFDCEGFFSLMQYHLSLYTDTQKGNGREPIQFSPGNHH